MTALQPDVFRLRTTRYIAHRPTPPQAAFLALPHREALYGGAAGGGKSDALLMAALQYVDVPGYAGLLLRRTFTELRMPGGLIPRAMEWLAATDAQWIGDEHTWTFPSGASLSFGHAEYEDSVYRYGSSEFQFIGFDQLETFLESQYRFMFSRARRPQDFPVPIRIRSAANPGSAWVKERFIPREDPLTKTQDFPRDEETGELRVFIPAKLQDNPYLDRAEYERTLQNLDPVTRARLLAGDWSAVVQGGMFRRSWFPIEEDLQKDVRYTRPIRRWDLAATPKTATNDPDWTAGAKMVREISKGNRAILEEGRPAGRWGIVDIARTRARSKDVEDLVQATAEMDGRETIIVIEQEPGSSGKSVIEYYKRRLVGYVVQAARTTGSKEVRAGPFASQAEAGRIFLMRGFWNGPFLDEAEAFPTPRVHDDMLDASIGAWEESRKVETAAYSF